MHSHCYWNARITSKCLKLLRKSERLNDTSTLMPTSESEVCEWTDAFERIIISNWFLIWRQFLLTQYRYLDQFMIIQSIANAFPREMSYKISPWVLEREKWFHNRRELLICNKYRQDRENSAISPTFLYLRFIRTHTHLWLPLFIVICIFCSMITYIY